MHILEKILAAAERAAVYATAAAARESAMMVELGENIFLAFRQEALKALRAAVKAIAASPQPGPSSRYNRVWSY